MKFLKKLLLILITVLILLCLGVIFFTRILARKGLPDYNQNVVLPGLIQSVTVYRDSYAIPHIYAQNETDLYLVTGYVVAQERMWQMDLLRRVTTGRLSEMFGEDFIETDIFLRSLHFSNKSKKILKETDSDIVNAVEAFAKGVNLYIEHYKGNYPLEFTLLGYEPEKWEAFHTVNLIGYMAWDLKAGWSQLILERIAAKVDTTRLMDILPDMDYQKTFVINNSGGQLLAINRLLELTKLADLGLDIFSGSNVWAVSGDRSATEKPILANDMHLAFGIPGIWMQIHQVVAGKLNVSGLILPGAPLIIVGHNDSIAWGMTNTYVDNLDFYEEKINPADTNQYLFEGEWINFDVVEETIKIKGGSEVKRTYRRNHRGPVVSEIKKETDRVLTIHWVGEDESNELRTVYKVNRAKNWSDFKEAFTSFRSISQNIGYADKQGNIGLYCCAGVPIRKRDTSYSVLPGWTAKYDWQGMVPFEELPHEFNPSRGYISAANNRTVDSTYPYHIGIWYDMPYRIDRIRELLNEKEKYSLDDFQRMQNDQHSIYSKLLLTKLLPWLEVDSGWNKTEQEAIELLSNWNYELSINSPEALISEYWTCYLEKHIFQDELGEELFAEFMKVTNLSRLAMHKLLISGELAWLDNIATDEEENLGDIAKSSFRETIRVLSDEYGSQPAKWEWGNAHTITLQHPIAKVRLLDMVFNLNRGPYRVGGSFHTVSPYKYEFLKFDDILHGSSHRNIFDLSAWDSSVSVIPTGISGICGSKFYCDQTKMYIQGMYHPDYFSKAEVKTNAVYQMIFNPE